MKNYITIRRGLSRGLVITVAVLLLVSIVLGILLIVEKTKVKVVEKETVIKVVTEVVTPSDTAKYIIRLDDYADCFTKEDVEAIARAIWGEAESVESKTQKAAVAWVILNQVDSQEDGMRGYKSIQDVLANKDNIQGYWAKLDEGEVPTEYKALAYDVLCRYYAEKDGWTSVGRIIPKDYIYWMGNGLDENYFVVEYHEGSLEYCKTNAWDWSLTSPYEN